MNPVNPTQSHNGAPSSILAELVDRLTARVQAGEPIDWQEVARQHPQHVGELRQLSRWSDPACRYFICQGIELGAHIFDRLYRHLLNDAEREE